MTKNNLDETVEKPNASKPSKLARILVSIFSILLLIFGGFVCYVTDYYEASEDARESLLTDTVSIYEEDRMLVFEPIEGTGDVGLIFYPGGKVDYKAYSPLMVELAQEGINCYLMKMPFKLAVFDKNAANRAIESNSSIERWYIAGHSLGGAMASKYAFDNQDKLSGIILLGSYSIYDFSDSHISMLMMYGSNDQIMNKQAYLENKKNVSSDYTEFVIDGGCHSYFGSYYLQKNDGIPFIPNESQINITKDRIIDFIR